LGLLLIQILKVIHFEVTLQLNTTFSENPYVYLSYAVDPIYGPPEEDFTTPTFIVCMLFIEVGTTQFVLESDQIDPQ
jgi:hypothetical protein